jgi:ketosteroid isomerase-like protein
MSERTPTEIEAAVLRANAEFYRAFSAADFPAMSELWAKQVPVLCYHPGSPVLTGRALVLESWRQILQEQPPFEMRCEQPQAHVIGTTAIVTCYEAHAQRPAQLAATNWFVLEAGQWRMVHHQAGPLARPMPRATPLPNLN